MLFIFSNFKIVYKIFILGQIVSKACLEFQFSCIHLLTGKIFILKQMLT